MASKAKRTRPEEGQREEMWENHKYMVVVK